MDSKVETTKDLYKILKHITNPDEHLVEFSEPNSEEHFGMMVNMAFDAIETLDWEEKQFIEDSVEDKNHKQTMKDGLKNDTKIIKNDFIRNIAGAIQDLGIISFQVMRPGAGSRRPGAGASRRRPGAGAIQDLVIIFLQVMRPGLGEMLRKQEARTTEAFYR